MQEIIKKLQKIVFNNQEVSKEQKINYIAILEGYKEVDNKSLDVLFKELLKKSEREPNTIIQFLTNSEEIIGKYIEKGGKGIIDFLNKKSK